MVTKEITAGARSQSGQAPVVQPEGEQSGLSGQFSQLLRNMLGGEQLSTVLDNAQALSAVSVSVAPPIEKKPVEVRSEPERPAEEEEVVLKDEGDPEVRTETDEKQETSTEATVDSATVMQAVVVTQQVREEAALVEAETGESLAPVAQQLLVQNMSQQGKSTESVDAQEIAAAESFQIQSKAVAAGAKQLGKDGRTESQGMAEGETIASPSVVKEGAVATVGKPVEKASETYYAIERAMDATDVEGENATPIDFTPEAPAPVVTTNKAALAQAELGKNAVAAQGMMSAGSQAMELTEKSVAGMAKGSGNGTVEIGAGAQFTLEKATAQKAKQASGLPTKDQVKVVEQVKELLAKAIQSRDGNSISVRLNPPELGLMTVKVTQRDSRVFARIIPESPEVEQMLKNRANDVMQVLAAAGLKPDQVHVSIGREQSDSDTQMFQDLMGRNEPKQKDSGSFGKEEAGYREIFGGLEQTLPSAVEVDLGWVA